MCAKIQYGLASKFVYTHEKRWDNNPSIQDNGIISVGTIMQYFAPDFINNIMPDNIPLLKSKFS